MREWEGERWVRCPCPRERLFSHRERGGGVKREGRKIEREGEKFWKGESYEMSERKIVREWKNWGRGEERSEKMGGGSQWKLLGRKREFEREERKRGRVKIQGFWLRMRGIRKAMNFSILSLSLSKFSLASILSPLSLSVFLTLKNVLPYPIQWISNYEEKTTPSNQTYYFLSLFFQLD